MAQKIVRTGKISVELACKMFSISSTCYRYKPKLKKETLVVPQRINAYWSMDFVHDQLENGRQYILLNIIDDFNREELDIEVDFSLPAMRVIRTYGSNNSMER